MRVTALALLLICTSAPSIADQVSRVEGRAAWERIHAVVSHPRCTNCHVGASGQPMWTGLGFGRRPHGMGIRSDATRIGAETVPCRTCHVTSGRANTVPHAAPHAAEPWQLPPVALAWFGKSGMEICLQLRDPQRNNGHDTASLVDHLTQSAFVAWGFAPGTGRSAPPGTPQTLANDVALWAAAGHPCKD